MARIPHKESDIDTFEIKTTFKSSLVLLNRKLPLAARLYLWRRTAKWSWVRIYFVDVPVQLERILRKWVTSMIFSLKALTVMSSKFKEKNKEVNTRTRDPISITLAELINSRVIIWERHHLKKFWFPKRHKSTKFYNVKTLDNISPTQPRNEI